MMKFYKISGLVLFLSLLTFNGHADTSAPSVIIKETTAAVLADIKENVDSYKKSPVKLYEFVENRVLKHFDFTRMTNLALGRYQRKINDEQRAAMEIEFKQLLVRTYSKALLEYEDQEVIYLPSKGSIERGDITIRTEIEQPGGFPIPLNYKLYLKDDVWKVYDISVDNVSLVTNYRSSFARQIKKDGIDGLIKSLKERNKSA